MNNNNNKYFNNKEMFNSRDTNKIESNIIIKPLERLRDE